MRAPEQAHEAQPLGHGVVDLVLRVPLVHLLPPGQRKLPEQLHHLQGFGIGRINHLSKDLSAESGHADGIAGQARHGRCGKRTVTSSQPMFLKHNRTFFPLSFRGMFLSHRSIVIVTQYIRKKEQYIKQQQST